MALSFAFRGVDKRKIGIVAFVGLMIFSIITAYAIQVLGTGTGLLILAASVGIPTIVGIVIYPRFGILVLLVSSYLIMWIYGMNLVDFPLGTLMDGLEALLLLGFFIKQKNRPSWWIFKNQISLFIVIWIGYNLLQFFNPITESRLAWLYTIRSVAVLMLMYFVFTYHIRTIEFIRLIVKIWLGLSVFAALYAIKQEYFGFFDYEQRTYDNDPLLQSLLFINGHWRKSSIFAEPVTFAYNMVLSSILCLCMMWGPRPLVKKIILGFMAAMFMTTMLYSGTRGAYVLLPAALVLFAVLNYNNKILGLSVVAGFFVLFLVNVPTSNVNLQRFQTAFTPSDDASFNLRKANQKRIQPYIQTHPIGGGLGATGVWGVRFAPNSYLAQFPPDSGFVRVAVELGWVGLLILCTLMFVILKSGINSYYRIRDPEIKSYTLAMILMLFVLVIANYPQEALVQFPTNIYFYLIIALINILPRLDQAGPPVEEKFILGK